MNNKLATQALKRAKKHLKTISIEKINYGVCAALEDSSNMWSSEVSDTVFALQDWIDELMGGSGFLVDWLEDRGMIQSCTPSGLGNADSIGLTG